MTDTDNDLDVLAICGSLRRGSFNRKLLAAAQELAPEGMRIAVYEGLRELPVYDGDEEADPPAPVLDLLALVESVDALMLVTPEYNYGVPGGLKNAIDWLSRPLGDVRRLERKPVAIMGASSGRFGTVRAQLALRQTFLWTQSRVVTNPEVMVTKAADAFDASGRLLDDQALNQIPVLLAGLAALARDPAGRVATP